jgi:hypothetical protein
MFTVHEWTGINWKRGEGSGSFEEELETLPYFQ